MIGQVLNQSMIEIHSTNHVILYIALAVRVILKNEKLGYIQNVLWDILNEKVLDMIQLKLNAASAQLSLCRVK